MTAVPSTSKLSLLNWKTLPRSPSSSSITPFPLTLTTFPNLEEQVDESKQPQKEMVHRVCVNLLADGLSTGKKLDGMQPLHNFQTWEWALEQLLQSSFPINKEKVKQVLAKIKQFVSQCKQQKKLYNKFSETEFIGMVKAHANQIEGLKNGESYALYGGWGNVAGGTGHALIYEFFRTDDHTFDVHLYTSTGYPLAANVLHYNKRLLHPVVAWKDVARDYLLARSHPDLPPIFLQQLIELDWCISNYDKNAVVDQKDILDAFDYLEPFLQPPSENFGVETEQIGGSCLPSVTKTCMRFIFDSLEEYKTFICYVNLILVTGVYCELNPHLKDAGEGEARTDLTYACEKLITFIDKLVGPKLIPENIAFDATKQLEEWISSLKKTTEEVSREKRKETKPVTLEKQVTQPQVDQRAKERYWVDQSQFCDNSAPQKSSFPLYVTLNTNNIPAFLDQVLKTYQEKVQEKNLAHYKQAANLGLHHAVDQLSIPESSSSTPWKDLSTDHLLACSERLRMLMVSYYKNTMATDLAPRRFATLFTLYAIIDHLACLISEKKGRSGAASFTSYSPPFLADKLNQIDSLTFSSAHEFERIEKAKAYFKKRPSSPIFQSEATTKVVKESIHEAPQNADLWQALLSSNKEFQVRVDQKAELDFRDYTDIEIEDDFQRQEKDLEKWYEEQITQPDIKRAKPRPQKLENLPLLTKRSLLLEAFDSESPLMGNALLAKDYQEINEVRLVAFLTNQAILHPQPHHSSLNRTPYRNPNHYALNCQVISNFFSGYDYSEADATRSFQDSWEEWLSSRQYVEISRYKYDPFFRLSQTKRNRSQWQRQTAEVQSLDKKDLHPLLHQTLRTLSEWKLTPYQLLYEWGKDYEIFKDSDMQAIFLRLFFRSPIGAKKVYLGSGGLIGAPDLLGNIKTFVDQGLAYFMQLKQKSGNEYTIRDIEGVKFLFEFLYLCQKHLAEQEQKGLLFSLDFSKELSDWIDDTTISRTPRALLRLYRLLSHSLTTPLEQLKDEQLTQICLDWTVVHLYCSEYRPRQISPLVFQCAEDFMANVLALHRKKFEKNPQLFCQPILDEVEGLLKVNWTIEEAHPIYQAKTVTGEIYRIDLRQGAVFTPTGKASRVLTHRSWESSPDFKRIFWKQYPFEYTRAGEGAVTFVHPHGGLFRILLERYYKQNTIQRMWQGEWYQYIPPSQVKTQKLGLADLFTYDHLLWAQVKVAEVQVVQVSSRGPASSGKSMPQIFLKTLKGLTITVELDVSKSLQDQVEILREKFREKLPEAQTIRFIFAGKALPLNQFLGQIGLQMGSTVHVVTHNNSPDNEYVLNLSQGPAIDKDRAANAPPPPVNLHSWKGIITSLKTGQPIWGIDKEGKIVEVVADNDFIKPSSSAPIYQLEAPDHGLENFESSDYIFTAFNDKKEVERVHLPRFRSCDGNPLVFVKKDKKTALLWKDNQQYQLEATPQGFFHSHKQYLYLTPQNPQDPAILLIPGDRFCTQEKGPVEEWGSIPYFEYHVHGDQIISQSTEGKFYLAYLYYKDEEYERAIEQLSAIDPIETISPLSFYILEKIQKMDPSVDHPNAAMVPLHATLQKISAKEKQSLEPITAHFGSSAQDLKTLSSIIHLAHRTLQSASHLQQGCQMATPLQKNLYQKLLNEIVEKKSLFTQLKITYPISLIFHLSYWLSSDWTKPQLLLNQRQMTPLNAECIYLCQMRFDLPKPPPNPSQYPSSYEAAFQSEQKKHAYECQLKTLWLTSGEVPFMVSRWPITAMSPKENGKLMKAVFEVAHSGNRQAQLAMLWQLRNWRLHWRGNTSDLATFDFLIQLLIAPQKYPHFIEDSASARAKVQFLEKLSSSQPHDKRDFQNTITQELQSRAKSLSSPPSHSKGSSPPTPPPLKRPPPEKEPALDDFGKHPQPLLNQIQGNYDQLRVDTLKKWRKDCFQSVVFPDKKKPYPKFRFTLKEGLLSKQEEAYKERIQKDMDILTQDYEEGVRQLENQEEISLTNQDLLLKEIRKESSACTTTLEQKKQEAHFLLNQFSQSIPFYRLFHRIAQAVTEVKKIVSLDQARQALLTFDQRAFKLLNPDLTEKQIRELAQLLIDIEDLKSWKAQLKRMEEHVVKASVIQDPQDWTRRDLCRRLLLELQADYHFKNHPPEDQVVYRISCGGKELIPFKSQVDLITEMFKNPDGSELEDCVKQLVMGGGKSEMVAPLVMEFIARCPGKAAFYIIPASLLKTVAYNLSRSLKKAFGRKLEVLVVKREELTLYRLEKILALLIEAKNTPLVIITPPSTLLIMELEFKSQARKLKRALLEMKKCIEEFHTASLSDQKLLELRIPQLKKQIEERKQKGALLAKILQIKGHALFDEVDMILDARLEYNFPEGEKAPVPIEYNNLAYTIFFLGMQADCKVDTLPGKPSMATVLNLKPKDPSSTAQKVEKSEPFEVRYLHAKAVLAKKLIAAFPPFQQRVPDHLVPAFERYLTEQMPSWVQDFADQKNFHFQESDLEKHKDWQVFGTLTQLQYDSYFLHLLQEWSCSTNPRVKNVLRLIDLTKELLNDILPITLSKNINRHYGAVPKDPGGKMCPYNGTFSPVIEREFSLFKEELCYYYQGASLSVPEEAVILQLTRLATKAAHYYMRKNGELFARTAEYEEIKELTDACLQDFQDSESIRCKEAMKTASNKLRNHPEKRLLLQKEIAAVQVKMQPEYLSANGISLCRRVQRRFAMTGTPWNWEGYFRKLALRFIADKGAEGTVLATLVRNVAKHHRHRVDLTQGVGAALMHVLKHSSRSKNIYGWIDITGALQVCSDSRTAAIEILKALEEGKKEGLVNPAIDTLLFFGKEEGEMQPNTSYIWQMGSPDPEKVEGTSPQALKAKSLTPQRYFTLYDEPHKTGTDVVQVPEAVNIVSISDRKTPLRDYSQGSMRLRQLKESQNIELMLTDEISEETIEDLLLVAAKTQSVRKIEDMPRYFKGQVDDIFDFYTTEQLINFFRGSAWQDDSFLELMDKGEPYFVHTLKDTLGESSQLRLKKDGDTKQGMKNRLTHLAKNFPFRSDKVDKEVAALHKHIEQAPLPPTMKTKNENIGMANEVEAAIEANINNEQEQHKAVEVDEEVETELQQYENIPASEYRPDSPLSYDQFTDLVRELSSPNPTLTSLSQQLRKFKYTFKGKQQQYDKLFCEPIYGTESYFNSCKLPLPVFHRLQRPPHQILVIQKEGKMRWLLLSEHESNSVKKYLEKNPNQFKEVWLIQPDATPLATTATPFPAEEDPVLKGLVEINIFNGNADWLGHYEKNLEPWLVGDFDLKLHFLKLRTARDPRQRQILAYLPSILKMTYEHQDVDLKSNHMVFSKRAERELAYAQGTYTPQSKVETKLLNTLKIIGKLSPQAIPDLGIDPTKQDAATQEALKELKKRHPQANEEELAALAFSHSQMQLKYLRKHQIPELTYDQVQWLHSDNFCHLKHSHQLMRTNDKKIEYSLKKKSDISYLEPEQGYLIPSINPDFYSELTEKQHIEHVPPEHVDKINPKYTCHLKPNQIKQGIKTVTLLNKFKEAFLPQDWKNVHGNLLQEIPAQYVIKSHIEEINDPFIIQKFDAIAPSTHLSQWTSWLTEKQVPHLLPTQTRLIPHINPQHYKYLTHPTLIQAVDPQHTEKLSPSHGEHLLDSQIKGITSLDTLKKFSSSFRKDTQWKAVHGNLLSGIPAQHVTQSQIEEIDDPRVIQRLDTIAPTYLHQWASWLTETQIPYLESKHTTLIPFINPQHYQHLKDAALIQAVGPQHIDKLSPSHGEHLKASQIQGIKSLQTLQKFKSSFKRDEQWNAVNGNWINEIPQEKVKQHHVLAVSDPDTLSSFEQKYISRWTPWLSEAQINKLKKPSLIQSLSFWQGLLILTKEQSHHRTYFQQKIETTARYLFGYLSKIALTTRIASLLQIAPLCQKYADRLDSFSTVQ